jgi:hypothetical protein
VDAVGKLSQETVERIIDDLETKAEAADNEAKASGLLYAAVQLQKALEDE